MPMAGTSGEESNTWCPRLTARMILSGSAVQVKGFGLGLCSTTKRLMAACRSTTETKTPRFNRRLVSFAKKPSTALSHEHDVGVKWNVKRSCRPSTHIGMLVGGVVVEDHMHGFAGRHFCLDRIEEADKLLMTMALHIASDHGSVEHVEGSKQRCGAVALVVVGHRSSTSLLQGKPRLGTIESLNLALFIDRQHNGVRGRIDIEADHIAQFIDELRIIRELELANPMGLEPMGTPNTLHRTDADANRLRPHGAGPVCGFTRRVRQRHGNHPFRHIRLERLDP